MSERIAASGKGTVLLPFAVFIFLETNFIGIPSFTGKESIPTHPRDNDVKE